MSVRDLTQQLGVSHNLIFQRFGRKEQLWSAAVDRFFEPLVGVLDHIVDEANDSSDDPLATYREAIVAFVEANARMPELARLMNIEAATDSDRLTYLFDKFIVRSVASMARLHGRLLERGVVRPVPPVTLFFLLGFGAPAPASHVPLARLLDPADPLDPIVARHHAEAVADLFLAGIQTPGGRRRR